MLVKLLCRLHRSIIAFASLTGALVSIPAGAQYVAWPAFGPERGLMRIDGLTDTLPDFVGPIDDSAELTIFTEGNHYPVLLPLVQDRFPAWCRITGSCRADGGKILVVTLPQPMIVEMLMKGGARIGNAVIPVGPDQHVFPDFVMAGRQPLHQLASAGLLERKGRVFARHRGLGLLLKHELADVSDVADFRSRVARVVLASESEPGARNQYRATLESLIGPDAAADLFTHEVRSFPGRLGVQHRDVPYAILNGVADGGIIFAHLATFYAQRYPDRLRSVAVPAAEPFGQEIAVARTTHERGPLAGAFERFFLEAARTAYPAGGFTADQNFRYGATVDLIER